MARILLTLKRGTVLFRHLRSRTSSVVNYPAFMAGFFLGARLFHYQNLEDGRVLDVFLDGAQFDGLEDAGAVLVGKTGGQPQLVADAGV